MFSIRLYSIISLLLFSVLGMQAQSRSCKLTIQVVSVEGDNLQGQTVTLMQTDYQVSYGLLTLAADGHCVVNVYPGNHSLSLERDGFNPVSHDFTVDESEKEKTVSVALSEKTRTPYALKATLSHDAFSGTDHIDLSWNQEEPAFFDDFESYTPFAISFGEWTGIDADNEAAAPIQGNYPNRGVMQYAQIINPLVVEPTWWYDYPILRPYSGQQYVGFTRTNSGNANDDWLISPVVTVGTDNVLSFMGKAADRYPERFMVYVTTVVDHPVQTDFTRLDLDNYETADYRGWHQYSYDLSAYAGQQIKFAIRYISHYNSYGSFMLMIDDAYVGQPTASRLASRLSSLSPSLSPANPYERFRILFDGQEVGTTEGYSFRISDVKSGSHTVGVQAVYMQSESEVATIQVDVPEPAYAHVVFSITAQSKLSPDGLQLQLTSVETAETYTLTVVDGQAELRSLPHGQYVVNIDEGAFDHYQQTISVNGAEATFPIVLTDHVLTPYNITAKADEQGIYTLRWNQDLLFCDSFEDYDDFATGTFGQWKSIDQDQQPVYPISLNGNIIAFPGSGTAYNPTAIAPMVFNPWSTTPAMLPTDKAVAAPSGDKTVIFFSPQRAKADKWLISPLFEIHENYQLSVTAKGYDATYPESVDFCISDGSDNPSDFSVISRVQALSSGEWTIYGTDLSAYAGQTVRLAVHYTSTDAFFAQLDDFTVGLESGEGEVVDYGNVVRFDISVDGQKVGESTQPFFVLPALSDGQHVIGIKAVYMYAESEVAEYVIDVTSGMATIQLGSTAPDAVYSLSGQYLGRHTLGLPAGIYLVKQNGKVMKIRR